MASLRNAMKSQREHRERHQPLARQHLGPMEKKKDYKIRAKDQFKKRKALETLRKKALDKNPDEFHFHMINSAIKDGRHYEKVEEETLSVRDAKEDLTYITHRRSIETKKIQKLKAQLHILDAGEDEPKNSHVIFVDSEKEVDTADPAKMLDTHPKLLGRSFNRLRRSQLQAPGLCTGDAKELTQSSKKQYKELSERIKREKKLRILQEKLEVRTQLMKNEEKAGGSKSKPKLIIDETSETAPIYKWPQERKK